MWSRKAGAVLLFTNQSNRYIIYIGSGRTGMNKTVYGLQSMVGVILAQSIRDIPPRRRKRGLRAAVRIAARCSVVHLCRRCRRLSQRHLTDR